MAVAGVAGVSGDFIIVALGEAGLPEDRALMVVGEIALTGADSTRSSVCEGLFCAFEAVVFMWLMWCEELELECDCVSGFWFWFCFWFCFWVDFVGILAPLVSMLRG